MPVPPSGPGAVQDSVTCPSPGLAASPFGDPGLLTPAFGVADAGPEAGPSPAWLTAVTLNEYVVPLVRPFTVVLVPVTLATGVLPVPW